MAAWRDLKKLIKETTGDDVGGAVLSFEHYTREVRVQKEIRE